MNNNNLDTYKNKYLKYNNLDTYKNKYLKYNNLDTYKNKYLKYNNLDTYKNKYLKYKNKYLALKNGIILGGAAKRLNQDDLQSELTELNKQLENPSNKSNQALLARKNELESLLSYSHYGINPEYLKQEYLQLQEEYKTASPEERTRINARKKEIFNSMLIKQRHVNNEITGELSELVEKMSSVGEHLMGQIKNIRISLIFMDTSILPVTINIANNIPFKKLLELSISDKTNNAFNKKRIDKLKEGLENSIKKNASIFNLCFKSKEEFEKFINEFSEKSIQAENVKRGLKIGKIRLIKNNKQLDLEKTAIELGLNNGDKLYVIYRLPIFHNPFDYWLIFNDLEPRHVSPRSTNFCEILRSEKNITNPYIPRE